MKAATHPAVQQRKKPVQQRSTLTVEAIAEATIQVLLAIGADRLTTTRVAARAGVSVGTLYQYYPNKEALLYAVLEAHLVKVAEAVENACRAHRGAPVNTLIGGVVEAFIGAKLERVDISTALYGAGSEPQGTVIVRRVSKRGIRAMTLAFADVSGLPTSEVELIALIMYSAMGGAMRSVLEAGAPPKMVIRFREELLMLCQAYAAKSLRAS